MNTTEMYGTTKGAAVPEPGDRDDRLDAEFTGERSLVESLRSNLAMLRVSDQIVLAVAAVSLLAKAPIAVAPTTLRMALFVALGLPGLVMLIRQTADSLPARWLTAFLVASFGSSLGSSNVLYALKADITGTPSWVFLAFGAGWWAMGRELTSAGRRMLPWALLVGFGMNVLVGLLQIIFDVTTGQLATFSGRASGLLDNPVYFGTIAAGLTSWAAGRAVRSERSVWLGLVLALSFSTGLSGSRVAAAAVFMVVLVAIVATRTVRAALTGAVAFVGFVLASLFTAAFAGALVANDTVNNSTIARISAGEGPGQRLQIWRYGVSAFLDRPLLGWGPGHFGYATWPRYSMEFVRDSGWNDVAQPWTYPHNIAILLLTTTGAVGVTLLAGFLVSGVRRGVDVPLLGLFIGAAVTWLLQPATVQSWPVVLLVLGAAMSAPVAKGWGSWRSPLSVVLLVGLLAGSWLAIANYRIGVAAERGDLDALEARAAWFPRDPAIAESVAAKMEIAGLAGEDRFDEAVEWSTKALQWAPESAMAHDQIAIRRYLSGDLVGMKRSIDRALEFQEWNPSARRLLAVHALATNDRIAAQSAVENVCLLRLKVCDEARLALEGLTP